MTRQIESGSPLERVLTLLLERQGDVYILRSSSSSSPASLQDCFAWQAQHLEQGQSNYFHSVSPLLPLWRPSSAFSHHCSRLVSWQWARLWSHGPHSDSVNWRLSHFVQFQGAVASPSCWRALFALAALAACMAMKLFSPGSNTQERCGKMFSACSLFPLSMLS